ncbi:MAG: HU family DNA-binding protein [Parabacteroides sp.]|nr:HU family DNA-binding protein [Parabacteroides sp.]
MNNKLSLSDIAALLSERTGKDKKAAEQFLREFIQVVSAGLFTDKIVKIKGLGTFKIIPVEERESVHVNTGERFIIPAHYKYSFLPDRELRDTVNAPFAFFETTEIGNDVDFSDLEEAEETEAATEDESVEEVLPEDSSTGNAIEEALDEEVFLEDSVEVQPQIENSVPAIEPAAPATGSDMQPEIVTVQPDTENKSGEEPQPETILPEENRLPEEDNLPEPDGKEEFYEDKNEVLAENPPAVSLKEDRLFADAGKTEDRENPAETPFLPEYGRPDPENSDREKQTKKSASAVKILVPVLLLVIAFVYLGSLFYEWYTESSGNTVTLAQIQETQTVNPNGNTDTDITALIPEEEDKTVPDSPTAMPVEENGSEETEKTEGKQSGIKSEPTAVPLPATRENTPQAQKPVVKKPAKIIDKVKIGAGDRLTLISLKYYGHKFFWVYLYEANKDVIKNPNNVPVGTTIKIPAPEVYGIDAHDKASVAKAAALQAKIIEGKD